MKRLYSFLIIALFMLSFAAAADWGGADKVLFENITAYYNMDDLSGGPTDSTGNFSLITQNITEYGQTGILGTALNFTGTANSNGTLAYNKTTTLGVNAFPMTINLWWKSSSVQNANLGTIIAFGNSADSDTKIVIRDQSNSAFLEIAADDAGIVSISPSVPIHTGDWFMLTAVLKTASSREFYINGDSVANNTASLNAVTIDQFAIGSTVGSGYSAPSHIFPSTGLIDEIGIWDRPLNVSVVKALYNGGSGEGYSSNSISQNSPANLQEIATSVQTFNCTATIGSGADTIENMSLYTNESGTFEQVNITTGLSGQTQTQTWDRNMASGTFLWGCSAGDNGDGVGFSGNRTLIVKKFFENNRTHNTTSLETASETFIVNVEGPSAVALLYNGTSYAMTKSGNDFSATIQIPINRLGNNTVIFRYDNEENSAASGQNVTPLNFTFCDATLTQKYLNLTFKNESDSAFINGSIPTSNFTYYLGSGTVAKEYIYVNNTEQLEFDFCSNSGTRPLYLDYRVQYESAGFPQRVADPSVVTLTNSSLTNHTLFLLPITEGIYVTFQVLNSAEQVIENVFITALRSISSEDVFVGAGFTDAAGALTLWLNPDFIHTFSFSKTGYTTLTKSFAPSQTGYTVSLGTGAVSSSDYSRGITYRIGPTNDTLLNDTSYDFEFTLNSTIWEVTSFGYVLKNGTGTIIGSSSASTNGGTLTLNLDTVKNSSIIMEYFWIINSTYSNYTKLWIVLDSEGTDWSLSTFITDFKSYVSTGMFGLDDFGVKIIIFIIIFMVTGLTSYMYGVVSTEGVVMILFFMVALLNWGFGFTIIGLPGSMDFFPTMFLGAIAIALFIRGATLK